MFLSDPNNVKIRAGRETPMNEGTEVEKVHFHSVAGCIGGGFLIGDSIPPLVLQDAHEVTAAAVAHGIMSSRHLHPELPKLIADELSRRMATEPEGEHPLVMILRSLKEAAEKANDNPPKSGKMKRAA